jgi:poly-gamma-glutamate synthesis protein (capsule biosynthesis protein)
VTAQAISISLSGDLMTGRGIDQILPHPVIPRLWERWAKSALRYVELAETANGPIPRPVDFPYIWGDALAEFERLRPDLRIVNLETSITRSENHFAKGINYRMSPENVPCLTAAGIDCCVLANNYVLDWGLEGLGETLRTLEKVAVRAVGAGDDIAQAAAPAILNVDARGRVIILAFGSPTSGIPLDWAASESRGGINLLPDLSGGTVRRIAGQVGSVKKAGDIVIASIHWGGNWGYEIAEEQIAFAHGLIDQAGVDVVYGHSSHHAKAVEVYGGKLILYGCGDLLNDYEGIRGYEKFRDDLALLYFARLDPADGRLTGLSMSPLQIRKFQLRRAAKADAQWLRDLLDREGKRFGTRVELADDYTLRLQWA